MTGRIRWGHDEPGDGVILDGSTGSVGTLDSAAFHIWKPPQAGGELVLTSDLPGQQDRRSFGSDTDALKAEAESFLSEFISSLGAVFPDFTSVTRFETIDHTRGLASISLDSTRAVVAYGTSVKLSVQDDGRTLKVFLGIPGEPATEEPQ